MKWSAMHYTDTGLVRTHNEDALIDSSDEHLWAVADGMGGHEAGDYASQHVVDQLGTYKYHVRPGICLSRLNDLLRKSNQHLLEKARDEHRGTIGCTVAALIVSRLHVICSWSGDSRIYRMRSGTLKQLTRDHNYGSLLEDRNVVQFPDSPSDNAEMLTAAIGGEETLHVEHCWFCLQADDRFLLCTDGLYKEMQDREIESALNDESDPDLIVQSLANLYKERGARDNAGIMYVYAKP